MRIVYHVLVEHRIWVADYESWQLFEFFVRLEIIFVKLFARGREEHSVNLGAALALDPNMLPVKCLCEHLAHLLILPEQAREAASARRAPTEAISRAQ